MTSPPEQGVCLDSSAVPKTQTSSTGEDEGDKNCLADTPSDSERHENELQRRASAVQDLAASYVRRSSHGDRANPFLADADDSPLNPKSPNFSATEWARAVVNIVSPESAPFRSAGVCFQNLSVHGFRSATDYHKDVANVWLSLADMARTVVGYGRPQVDILHQLNGLVKKGEMLVVLGPPGSGCSTFLKTVAGELNGLHVGEGSYFNYQGMTAAEMHSHHRGEAIYTAEVDVHFPMLTVSDTLTFAARARQPRHLPPGISKVDFADHLRDVIMAVFGISHTSNTMVGDEYVRGVSGGERKRVTICEAALSGAPLQCWDNSTRGLDSANALEFCRALRLETQLFSSTACVSIYQAPQAAYDLFDKALVLYEGRQIFFGRADEAKAYFVGLGFACPPRQTTPDFLTSMTAPGERIVRPGFEAQVPRTPDEFAAAWTKSAPYQALQAQIKQFKVDHPINGPDADAFRASKKAQQARGQRTKSPYILSYPQQIQLCLWRGWKRLTGDPGVTIGGLIAHAILAIIVGSLFFNLDQTSSTFFNRGALLFYACLLNAFSSALEILTLFAQRPIVEKHRRYAFYHPSAEAVASMLCSMPNKIADSIIFNIIIYFMTDLRREPGAFFFFWLISFSTVLVMSMIFRTIGSASRSLFQALVPAGLLMLDLIIFTGFVLPQRYMLGWSRWLNYLDPLAYAFESLMVNEFHGRKFTCDQYVPNGDLAPYARVSGENRACRSVGSRPGQDYILGDDYLRSAFDYSWDHRWRNFGIIVAFTVAIMVGYLVTAELVPEKKSRGEVLVYRRGHKPLAAAGGFTEKINNNDPEAAVSQIGPVSAPKWERDFGGGGGIKGRSGLLQQHTSVFQWHDVCYDIKIKKTTRRILDHVDGWVKPGTLTALMGVSGAGKTSLLDCLADRTAVGVITGEMLVNGYPRGPSFQRSTGYVQQQDLHLPTSTVREALHFSALLRQPAHVPRADKLAYVEEVVTLLEMEDYADAIIGVPGEGLNVEQRKRLTIAVELVAKPPLLLFVDEPTSGLDSQTSWAILDLLDKLTKAGQAIICTIHQPSAVLFQRFDRLLLLAEGGKTVYFGEIGDQYQTMAGYFVRNGGRPCPPDANPAEWMLETIGAAPGSTTDIDWFKTWRESPEYRAVQRELEAMKAEKRHLPPVVTTSKDSEGYGEFAAPFAVQLRENLFRVFQQYWRTPTYIYAKAALCTLIPLFIGFIFFRAKNSIQGLQSQMFSIFNLFTIFGQIVQQSIPQFVIQRSLYEARERPAKVYSWKVFILAQIFVELPWNCLMAVFMYCSWYYPIALFRNTELEHQTAERGALVFLFLLIFMVFAGTFSTFMVSGFNSASAGGTLADLMFSFCLMFCGVLVPLGSLPRFWIFMYRVSPFTYMVSGVLSAAVANAAVVCADNELLSFAPANGSSCGDYMAAYIQSNTGYLMDNGSTTECLFCPISETNNYLASVNVYYGDRWRNFGILWAYILFNIAGALVIYRLARVPKKRTAPKHKEE
ncbi:ABC-2 type transporter [Niveomyces insectorum RCEF 264]|uniref:ABC-2 type transporter n=1 Tax=Niveomyces insectorum RCEF 264 TaxID=1081102 RepID=A0A167SKA6_9HYPO|nr:ABC-2 type transporter [Niveomyces insectorum RCEF 264]